MELLQISQYILLGAVIAGVTELLARLRTKDYWVATTVATSALIGLLFGVFGVEGLTPVVGLAAGFGASGFISTVGSFGKKSTPAPSRVIEVKHL